MHRIMTAVVSLALLPAFAGAQDDKPYRIIAELDRPPGNITSVSTGTRSDLYISLHQMFGVEQRLGRMQPVLRDGAFDSVIEPFPTADWADGPEGNHIGFDALLGLHGTTDRLYLLDNANRSDAAIPKLVIFRGAQHERRMTWPNILDRVIYMPDPYGAGMEDVGPSFHNDLAVHEPSGHVFTADFGTPSIGVVNLETGLTRYRLVGHELVQPEEDASMIINGREVTRNGEPARIGINPIAMGPQQKWVYFGAMHGTSVYRVKATDLIDFELTDEQLAKRVDRYGDKPVSDGIAVDRFGNVYITDVQAGGIGVTRPDGSYELMFSDPDVIQWPDSIARRGNRYVAVVNQLHLSAPLNGGVNEAEPPYYIISFQGLDQ